MSILLIQPPVVKPCEPPAGLAKLAGALESHGIGCFLLDANIEGLLSVINSTDSAAAGDTWSRRAVKNKNYNTAMLRKSDTYIRPAHYRRAVSDLNRLLALKGAESGIRLSLSDYQDKELSPLNSRDLLRAAEHPERNPFFPYFEHRLSDLLDTEKFTLTGISLNYLSQAITAFAMIGFIKKKYPGHSVALGGGLITSWMQRFNVSHFQGLADHLVAGPGEADLLALSGVDQPSLDCYVPSFGGFPWHDYIAPGPILPYSASSGCWWRRCSFCPERTEKNSYRPLSNEKVISDLTCLKNHIKPSLIHLLDNAISPGFMTTLIRSDLNVPWYGFARFTSDLSDPDFCTALKRSGCRMLQLGLESGDQSVLDQLEKGIDLDAASRALRHLKTAGIKTYIYLLFGTPAEDEIKARRTLDFIIKHGTCIDFLNIALFNLPVNSAFRLETSSFYGGDLSLYTDFLHPKGWERRTARRFIEKEFKVHPVIKPILLRDPPWFTSNHAPFL